MSSKDVPQIVYLIGKKVGALGILVRVVLVFVAFTLLAFCGIGIYFMKEHRNLPQVFSDRIESIQGQNTYLAETINRIRRNIDINILRRNYDRFSGLASTVRPTPDFCEVADSVIGAFSACGRLEYSASLLNYFEEIAINVSTPQSIFRKYPLAFPFADDEKFVVKRAFSAEENMLCPFTGIMRSHLGVELAAELSTPVLAPANGEVIAVGNDGFWGRTIRMRHADNYETFYAHLGSVLVRAGQRVARGTPIGTVGQSGWTTGSYLHYAIIRNGVHVDPLLYNFSFLYGD